MAMRYIESENALGKFTQDPDGEKAGLARLLVEGSKLWVARYGDIPLPNAETVEGSERVIVPKLEIPQQTVDSKEILSLQQAITELKKSPTPESVTNYWRAKFQIDGARAGLSIEVPDCDWTEEEIKRPMVDIKGNPVPGMMIYKPEQLAGKEGLIILGKTYPEMVSYSIGEDTPIKNTHKTSGWIKVEATIDAPNRNTHQKELGDLAKEQVYLGQRESTYILASQASKDLTG